MKPIPYAMPMDGDSFGDAALYPVSREPAGPTKRETPAPAALPFPFEIVSYSTDDLVHVAYADSGQRLEALSSLPSLIRSSRNNVPLHTEALRVLLDGVPLAHDAALVQFVSDAVSPELFVRVVQARQRPGTTLAIRPQHDLVCEALRRRQSMIHRGPGVTPYTTDWAFCVPLPDEPQAGMALVMNGSAPGQSASDAELRSDLKFAKLVADVIGSLLLVQDLQNRQALLSRFFTDSVLAALDGPGGAQALTPRPATVTVLFCDLHGSCQLAEEEDADLAVLCDRMMEALNIMTEKIVHEQGVISDFQGDAALGFWGWPFEQPDQVERAARAALAIRKEFLQLAQKPTSPLHGFRCGIGIAHGPAIAGKIGTTDQCKIGVFGPVVNLASRLEALTRRFQAPILLDEAAAGRLDGAAQRRWCRLRRLARVQPKGMTRTCNLHELLPPRHDTSALAESARLDYEAALDAFMIKDWDNARARLGELPDDGPSQLIRHYMARHNHTPPPDWDGTIVFHAK